MFQHARGSRVGRVVTNSIWGTIKLRYQHISFCELFVICVSATTALGALRVGVRTSACGAAGCGPKTRVRTLIYRLVGQGMPCVPQTWKLGGNIGWPAGMRTGSGGRMCTSYIVGWQGCAMRPTSHRNLPYEGICTRGIVFLDFEFGLAMALTLELGDWRTRLLVGSFAVCARKCETIRKRSVVWGHERNGGLETEIWVGRRRGMRPTIGWWHRGGRVGLSGRVGGCRSHGVVGYSARSRRAVTLVANNTIDRETR
ncbi:hypothetical protein B0H10DRAFT_2012830 [Mycena sp. CBHHK59/15]|nr:hypothetical protein B0H10DRAFT_2012830 [Mycena sp. CBHHK59/15]